MDFQEITAWLLEGDVSIQYQVHRDLLGEDRPDLRRRIEHEGWGAAFLKNRKSEGHWGDRFYQPKWISTHYTLLDLKNLGISPEQPRIRESIQDVLDTLKGPDGGVSPFTPEKKCDVCVNGMFLNYAAYFGMAEEDLISIVDFLLAEHMPDGGYNCESNFKGAVHSSLHSTICVLEGILEYSQTGYSYRKKKKKNSARESEEFILQHRLFRSDKTGEIIDKKMLMLSYPSRWRYDVLRTLDYFQAAGIDYVSRMADAFAVLLKKRRKNGTWPDQARHPGQTHFEMEKTGGPSRWNTLRALRVLNHFPEGAAVPAPAGSLKDFLTA